LDLRILIDTIGKRLHHDVPVSLYWNAGEDRSQNGGHSACYTDAHGDVNRQSRSLEREDAPVLEQDRKLCHE
jgi:hypothetical protein